MTTRLHRTVATLAVLAAVATGCSRGGSSSTDDAAAPPGQASTAGGEHPVQFVGAGKVRLFGILSLPTTRSGRASPPPS